MKIGIIGTRGIPNYYGGFEEFAEFVAPALVKRGHSVVVYNSSLHPYRQSEWNGVKLITRYDPEDRMGTFGQFIYDLNCILDAHRRRFDVILQLGYTSSSIWSWLMPSKPVIITNMDGLEWKRSRYSRKVQKFLKRAEKWAAFSSHQLISDSKEIQSYLLSEYGRSSRYIAYGASLFTKPEESMLERMSLSKYNYNMLVARMEPENNIEMILEGHVHSNSTKRLILVGNYNNHFGTYLKNKYTDKRIQFWGPIYDLQLLNNLRHFSSLYFHGHTVGGTNPSLLEAMASQALIVAHDNVFNKSVLDGDALYFSSAKEITDLIEKCIDKDRYASFIQNNSEKIIRFYSWDYVTDQIEKCFSDALRERRQEK
jgi:glycosyltransferase involved in cell wall biosynthesis